MSLKTFYANGAGDALIDPANYPQSIVEFLDFEREILTQHMSDKQMLIEVGCMHGRYLEWALQNGASYLGFDVVDRYVAEGNARIASAGADPQKHRILLGASEQLHEIIPGLFGRLPDRALVFFPFNSIGNMDLLEPVVLSLSKLNLPFLISTYRTDQQSNLERLAYYQNAGFGSIVQTVSEAGVCFSSPNGLCSMAYHPLFLHETFARYHVDAQMQVKGGIGIWYFGL